MIVASDMDLKIGSVSNIGTLTDYQGNSYSKQPMYVRRRATFDEWKQALQDAGVWKEERGWRPKTIGCVYFYEVSTD